MKPNYETQWEQCLDIIRDNLNNEEAYKAFFSQTKAIGYADNKLVLQIPSHFVFERLESEYFDLLKKTLQRVFGPKIQLEYQIQITQEQEVKVEPTAHPEVAQTPEFDSHLNPNCTFASFFQGKSNELALSAALSVANKPGNNAFNPFFIFGASGVGKTHLAQAIGLYVCEHNPGSRVLYVPAHLFKIQYMEATRNNQLNDFINFYRSVDVLIVDDIQEFAGKNLTATQNTFFHIFNYLHEAGKQLVMTCDRPPVELAEDLIPRLLTRFKWGFIGEIEHPDYELRRNILKGKCQKEGLSITEDVIDFIARNATDNVRDLEGIINSLLAHSIAFNRPIDQELAARVMRMIVKIEQKVITCEAILQQVVAVFSIDMKSINSKSRKREIVWARQAAMSLCKKYTTHSVSRIGQVIGGRDHATVLHALKNVDDLLQTEADFKQMYQQVETRLTAK
ncbi:MAG: chromosomal replication initiator protein DnaA [Bacteroidales bacterium]|nr:chromosomal replication initiator protein DnaA [Bacteroidales bacterium]